MGLVNLWAIGDKEPAEAVVNGKSLLSDLIRAAVLCCPPGENREAVNPQSSQRHQTAEAQELGRGV